MEVREKGKETHRDRETVTHRRETETERQRDRETGPRTGMGRETCMII